MNALKCDRCGSYFDYVPEVEFNYISFGYKDIIPSKKIKTKDICPECMEKFLLWINNKYSDFCEREFCKGCEEFGWVCDFEGKEHGFYTCSLRNTKVSDNIAVRENINWSHFLQSTLIFREEK